MSDDPRHGTISGYNRIPCREECCRRAMANYKARWDWDRLNGRERIVSTIGTRRRIQALNALGWSNHEIAKRLGNDRSNLTRLIYGDTMTRALAERVAAVYDELSMRLPTGNPQAIINVRNRARRRGFAPPLAWDDDEIDNPAASPRGTGARPRARHRTDLDQSLVERVLTGEWSLGTNCTVAERAEICRRFVREGGTLLDLERLTGWKPDRYYRISANSPQVRGSEGSAWENRDGPDRAVSATQPGPDHLSLANNERG